MQAKTQIYGALIRQCRMMRMSPDVEMARAALDVEQELVGVVRAAGLPLPEPAAPVRRRRNRRSSADAAVTAGGAA
jgi:hypothetical protein